MEDNMQSASDSANSRTIDYNSICQIIGHLYLEWHNAKIESEKRFSSIIDNLSKQVSELISENESLRSENEDGQK